MMNPARVPRSAPGAGSPDQRPQLDLVALALLGPLGFLTLDPAAQRAKAGLFGIACAVMTLLCFALLFARSRASRRESHNGIRVRSPGLLAMTLTYGLGAAAWSFRYFYSQSPQFIVYVQRTALFATLVITVVGASRIIRDWEARPAGPLT